MDDKTYTVKEVSEMIGKDQETIRRCIRDGRLKATKSSRKTGYRINHKDLLDSGLVSKKYDESVEIFVVEGIWMGYQLDINMRIYGVYADEKDAKILAQKLRANDKRGTKFVIEIYQLKRYEIINLKRRLDFSNDEEVYTNENENKQCLSKDMQ